MPFLAAPAILGGLIGGGGALAGGLLSRGAGNSIANQQQQQFQSIRQLTEPAFKQAYGYYSSLLGNDPSLLMQAVGPDITNTNLLFQQAQRNMIGSSMGRGGGLTAGLANLEGQRASTLSNLIGTARAGAPAALANLASGQQTQALSALAGAQASQYQNALLQQQAMGGIGAFITRLLSNPNMFNSNQNTTNVNLQGMGILGPSLLPANTGLSPVQFLPKSYQTDIMNPPFSYYPTTGNV